MAVSTLQFSAVIVICLLLLVAGYVAGSSEGVFRSTRKPKSPPIPPSDARFAKVEAEMAELFLILEKLTTQVRRIGSRESMQARRAAIHSPTTPPIGTPKSELRRFYNVAGLTPKQFAEKQAATDMQQE